MSSTFISILLLSPSLSFNIFIVSNGLYSLVFLFSLLSLLLLLSVLVIAIWLFFILIAFLFNFPLIFGLSNNCELFIKEEIFILYISSRDSLLDNKLMISDFFCFLSFLSSSKSVSNFFIEFEFFIYLLSISAISEIIF